MSKASFPKIVKFNQTCNINASLSVLLSSFPIRRSRPAGGYLIPDQFNSFGVDLYFDEWLGLLR